MTEHAALKQAIRARVSEVLTPLGPSYFVDDQPSNPAGLDEWIEVSISITARSPVTTGDGAGPMVDVTGFVSFLIATKAGEGTARSESLVDSISTGMDFWNPAGPLGGRLLFGASTPRRGERRDRDGAPWWQTTLFCPFEFQEA